MSNKMRFLAREHSGTVFGDRPFIAATKWTLKFHLENYSRQLFPEVHTSLQDWVALTDGEAEPYLPATRESLRLTRVGMSRKLVNISKMQQLEWRRLKLFESDVIDGIPLFFAGGPVWALAWCSLPLYSLIKTDCRMSQFLAISTHRNMEDVHCVGYEYKGPGLIQIWDFGHMDNQMIVDTPPKLVLGIAHEYGAVWCMEWCPSGCYDPEPGGGMLPRLGLLAIACSDGTIRIFSVCLPSKLTHTARAPVFKSEPLITLVLDTVKTYKLGKMDWQCTRLSWFKGKDHRTLAAGFTNGMVALYNLGIKSPLLRKMSGKFCTLLPYHMFQAHLENVSALCWSPHPKGRYLMTGSFDRSTKFWDLEDTSAPITVNRKGLVTDGVWLTHWIGAVNSYDDSYSLAHTNASIHTVRNFGYLSYPLLAQNSASWSVSASDWVNGVAQGNQAGELTVIFPHQLLLAVDSEKGMKNKRMIISYIETRNFDATEDLIVDNKKDNRGRSKSSTKVKKMEVGNNKQSNDVAFTLRTGNISDCDVGNSSMPGTHATDKPDDTLGAIQLYVDDQITSVTENKLNISKQKRFTITQGNEQNLVVNMGEPNDRTGDSGLSNVANDINLESCPEVYCMEEAVKDSKMVKVMQRSDELLLESEQDDTVQSSHSLRAAEDVESLDDEDFHESGMIGKEVYDWNTSLLTILQDSIDSASAEKKDFEPKTYDEAIKKYGMIICDFPTENLKRMPPEARSWMKQSDKMRPVSVEMYPLFSINKVSWNPNCRSFLSLAAGYQCGLVRVPNVKAMHTSEVESILRDAARNEPSL